MTMRTLVSLLALLALASATKQPSQVVLRESETFKPSRFATEITRSDEYSPLG